MKEVALDSRRREVGELLGGQEHRLVLCGPVGLAPLHEVGDGGKGMVVDRGLDVEHAHRVLYQLTLPDARVMER